MKSICITGAFPTDLLPVSDILQRAGMAPPRPVRRDDSMDMAFWHEQVLAAITEESAETPLLDPGRLWSQLASDIFAANINSKVWGWADCRSLWLLDYWLKFDPRVHFVLVTVPPHRALARAIASGREPILVGPAMDLWHRSHAELLRFHHRNPRRSVLVDADECGANPDALIERCVAQWSAAFVAPSAEEAIRENADPLSLYLARQLCQDFPESIALQRELGATVAHLGKTDKADSGSTPTLEQVIAQYRDLRDGSTDLGNARAAVDSLNTRLDESLARQDALGKRIEEETGVNERLLLQLLQLQEELDVAVRKGDAHAQALETARSKLEEGDLAGELLRAQLRQVEEELERSFVQQRAMETQLAESQERWKQMLLQKPVDRAPVSSNGSGNGGNHLLRSFTRLLKKQGDHPADVRYGRVHLKREQVNPDYEHLWLRFENLAVAEKASTAFEFRLSCAHVRPGHFGRYPKLEFPQGPGEAPFENWFVEAYDDFGPKLELRFALPESNEPESMDLAVWHSISERDRAFLRGLIQTLPAALRELKTAAVSIRRPWDDWLNMVGEIQRVVALRGTPPRLRARFAPARPADQSRTVKSP